MNERESVADLGGAIVPLSKQGGGSQQPVFQASPFICLFVA